MKKQFWMTRGLPGCGKSTWAEGMVRNHYGRGTAVRINRDLFRDMLHAGRDDVYDRKLEGLVTTAHRATIAALMMSEVPVIICDDTNFHNECEPAFRKLCEQFGYEFHLKDFTDVPVSTCIQNDLKRTHSVGEKVIKQMYARNLEPKYEPATVNPDLPWAVIVDIDGTLAHMNGRSPYDYSKVHTDLVDEVVRDLVTDAVNRGDVILVVSGRDDNCKDVTEAWLDSSQVIYDEIHMRVTGDKRKDSIVKSEIFDREIAPRYNIRYVLDDRNQVVEMWRQRGLKVLQVADGDF